MGARKNVAICLIVLGGVVLIRVSGMVFATGSDSIDHIPSHIESLRPHISPVVGAVALIGGIVLLISSGKED